MGGFDRPILHGLCSYGFTGRALLHSLCGSDPARFHHIEARFASPVLPGEALTVRAWETGDGEAVFTTSVGDRVVIDQRPPPAHLTGPPMAGPVIYTRREFLARTAAAQLACWSLAGCSPPAPTTDRRQPSALASPHDDLARIVGVAVHPSIGIARVGNSADSFFFGPDLPGTLPVAPDGFKDASGAIARQAARFRVYGYDAAGRRGPELTAADADIAWTVSVANKKAAWYDFNTAMDIPVAAAGRIDATPTSPAPPATAS